MEKETRVLQLQPEIRAGSDGKQLIVGYAVKWRSLSSPIYGLWREKFEPGAFTASLIERANDIFATWQHDVADTIGRSPTTLTLREDETGLFYEIDPPTWADRYIESIQRGDVRGSSFTFSATVDEYDYESDPNYVIRTVKRAELFEVAPVTMPAYPASTAGIRSDDQVAQAILLEKQKRQSKTSDYLAREHTLRELSLHK